MKLTEFFFNNKQITDTGKTQSHSALNAVISRQIRALMPGQIIQGEILSRSGDEVQIKLIDDLVLNARLDRNMNLEVGKSMLFEVKNNGRALTLSPLFANVATDANVLKALDMAALPLNNSTIPMTKLMMEAGLSIDKNSIQQVYREINAFPDADMSDIVDLHKLGMPVNEENVNQIAAYKNLTHQLTSGMNQVLDALPDTFQGMLQAGNAREAAGLYLELLALVESELPQVQATVVPEGIQSSEVQTAVVPEGIQSSEVQTVVVPEGIQSSEVQAVITPESVSGGQGQESASVNPQMLAGEQTTGGQMAMVKQLLTRAVNEGNTELLRSVLSGKEVQRLLMQNLQQLWTITPKEVADEKKVTELYQRLYRQLKGIVKALEISNQTTSTAYQATIGMSQNIDFLQQFNQMYAYVQLPLRLQQGEAHGELYVYTNKRNLAQKNGQISALLHLDMEHLGPVDVYVAMQAGKVNTKFYVQDEKMLDFLEAHMDLLTQRLAKRGYSCSMDMQVRSGAESVQSGIRPLLEQESHAPLVHYAFDVRA